MTPGQVQTIVAVLITALVSTAVVGPLLRWLPQRGQPDEPVYRTLTQPRFVLACVLCSAVAAALSWTTLPPEVQPLWSVLAVAGVLLAAIDAATTWLPLPLVQATWAAMAVATLTGVSLGGGWDLLLRAAGGAAIAGGLYLIVWLVSRGGFGFGDVRFAPLLGAATAAHSWGLLSGALLAGSLLGGLHGLLHLLRRRPGGFPYAPAMLGGGYGAALVQWLVR